MPHLSLDTALHLVELLAVLIAIMRSAVTFRDTIRDLAAATKSLRGDVDDHEDRLRVIEGKPMRRYKDAVDGRRSVLGI